MPLAQAIQEEVDFINRLLKQLHQLSLTNFHRRKSGWEKPRMADVLEQIQPFSSPQFLESRLPSAERPMGRLLTANHLIFLDFVETGGNALPIVDMFWDLRQPVSEIEVRFRFFLLRWESGEPQGMGDLLAIMLLGLYGLKQLERFRDLDGFPELSERLHSMGIIHRSPKSPH